jgi:hypothetical protein
MKVNDGIKKLEKALQMGAYIEMLSVVLDDSLTLLCQKLIIVLVKFFSKVRSQLKRLLLAWWDSCFITSRKQMNSILYLKINKLFRILTPK